MSMVINSTTTVTVYYDVLSFPQDFSRNSCIPIGFTMGRSLFRLRSVKAHLPRTISSSHISKPWAIGDGASSLSSSSRVSTER